MDVSGESGAEFARPALHRGAVFADFNQDGGIDVAVTALNGPIELWWNRGTQQGPPPHWLQLRLTGTRSNRSAIGAVVHCKAGGHMQQRTVSSSVGYASSSDLTVHFGLGDATRAWIEINWPSSIVQTLGEIAVNQRMNVTEPERK